MTKFLKLFHTQRADVLFTVKEQLINSLETMQSEQDRIEKIKDLMKQLKLSEDYIKSDAPRFLTELIEKVRSTEKARQITIGAHTKVAPVTTEVVKDIEKYPFESFGVMARGQAMEGETKATVIPQQSVGDIVNLSAGFKYIESKTGELLRISDDKREKEIQKMEKELINTFKFNQDKVDEILDFLKKMSQDIKDNPPEI